MAQTRELPEDGLAYDFPDDWSKERIDNWLYYEKEAGTLRETRSQLLKDELVRMSKAGPEYGAGLKMMQATSNLSNGFFSMFLSAAESPLRLMSGVYDIASGSGAKILKSDFDPNDPMAGIAQGLTRSQGGNVFNRMANWMRYQNETLNDYLTYAQPEGEGYSVEKALVRDIPQGLGSTLSFITGGALLKGVGMGSTAAVATLGSMSAFSDGYDRASKAGNSETTSMVMALMNAGVGASEALPISKWLGGGLNRTGMTMRDVIAEGGEEAIQEFVQSLSDDGIHSGFWNANLWGKEHISLLESVKDAAYASAIGGVTGFGVSGAQLASQNIEINRLLAQAGKGHDRYLQGEYDKKWYGNLESAPRAESPDRLLQTRGTSYSEGQYEYQSLDPSLPKSGTVSPDRRIEANISNDISVSADEAERLRKSRSMAHDQNLIPTLDRSVGMYVNPKKLEEAKAQGADSSNLKVNALDLETLVDVSSINLLPTNDEEVRLLNRYEANRSRITGLILYSGAGDVARSLGTNEEYTDNYKGKALSDRKIYAEWLSGQLQYADALESSGEKAGADSIRTFVASLYGLNYSPNTKRFPAIYNANDIKAASPKRNERMRNADIVRLQYPVGASVEIDAYENGVSVMRGQVIGHEIDDKGDMQIQIGMPSGGNIKVDARHVNRIHQNRFGFESSNVDYTGTKTSLEIQGATGDQIVEVEGKQAVVPTAFITGPLYGQSNAGEVASVSFPTTAPASPETKVDVPAVQSTAQTKKAARALSDRLTDGSVLLDYKGNTYTVSKVVSENKIESILLNKDGGKVATISTTSLIPKKRGKGVKKGTVSYDPDGLAIIETSKFQIKSERMEEVAAQADPVVDDDLQGLMETQDQLTAMSLSPTRATGTNFRSKVNELAKSGVLTKKQADKLKKGVTKQEVLLDSLNELDGILTKVINKRTKEAQKAAKNSPQQAVMKKSVVVMTDWANGPLYEQLTGESAAPAETGITAEQRVQQIISQRNVQTFSFESEVLDPNVEAESAMMLLASKTGTVLMPINGGISLIQRTYDPATGEQQIVSVSAAERSMDEDMNPIPVSKMASRKVLATLKDNQWTYEKGTLALIARSKMSVAVPKTFLSMTLATDRRTTDASSQSADERASGPIPDWWQDSPTQKQTGTVQDMVWNVGFNAWASLPDASLPLGASIDPSYSWVNQGYSDEDVQLSDMDLMTDAVGIMPALDEETARQNLQMYAEGSRVFTTDESPELLLSQMDEEYIDQHMDLLRISKISRGEVKTPVQKISELREAYLSRNRNFKRRARLMSFTRTLEKVISSGAKVTPDVFQSLYEVDQAEAIDQLGHYIKRQSMMHEGISNEAILDYPTMTTGGVDAPAQAEYGSTIPVRVLGYDAVDGVVMPVVEVMGNWTLPDGKVLTSGQTVSWNTDAAKSGVTPVAYDIQMPATPEQGGKPTGTEGQPLTHTEASALADKQIGTEKTAGEGKVSEKAEVVIAQHIPGDGKYNGDGTIEQKRVIFDIDPDTGKTAVGNWQLADDFASLDSSVARRTTGPEGFVETEIYYPIYVQPEYKIGSDVTGKTGRYYIGYEARGTQQLDPSNDKLALKYDANKPMAIQEVDEFGKKDPKNHTDIWIQRPAVYVVMYDTAGAPIGHYRFQTQPEARDFVAERMRKEGTTERMVKLPKLETIASKAVRKYPGMRMMSGEFRKDLYKLLRGRVSRDKQLDKLLIKRLKKAYANRYNEVFDKAEALYQKLVSSRRAGVPMFTKFAQQLYDWDMIDTRTKNRIINDVVQNKDLSLADKKRMILEMVKLPERQSAPEIMDEISKAAERTYEIGYKRIVPKVYRQRSIKIDEEGMETVMVLNYRANRVKTQDDTDAVARAVAVQSSARRARIAKGAQETQTEAELKDIETFLSLSPAQRLEGVPPNFRASKTEGTRVILRDRPDRGAYLVVGIGIINNHPDSGTLMVAPIKVKSDGKTEEVDYSSMFTVAQLYLIPESEKNSPKYQADINNPIYADSGSVSEEKTANAQSAAGGGQTQITELSEKERADQVVTASPTGFNLESVIAWDSGAFSNAVDLEGAGSYQLLGAKIGRNLVKTKADIASLTAKLQSLDQVRDYEQAEAMKIAIGIATGDPMAATPHARISALVRQDPTFSVPVRSVEPSQIAGMAGEGQITGVGQASGRMVSGVIDGATAKVPVESVYGNPDPSRKGNYGYDQYKQDLQRMSSSLARYSASTESGVLHHTGAESDIINSRVTPDWEIASLADMDLINFILLAETQSRGSIRQAAWRTGRTLRSEIEFEQLVSQRNNLLKQAMRGRIGDMPAFGSSASTARVKEWMQRTNPNKATRALAIVELFYNEAIRAATGRSLTVGVVDRFALYEDVTYKPPMVCASPCRVPGQNVSSDRPGSRPAEVAAFFQNEADVLWDNWNVKDPNAVTTKSLRSKLLNPANRAKLNKMIGKGAMDKIAEDLLSTKYIPRNPEQRRAQAEAIVEVFSNDPDSLNNLAGIVMGRAKGIDHSGIPEDALPYIVTSMLNKLAGWIDSTSDRGAKTLYTDMTQRILAALSYHGHRLGSGLNAMKDALFQAHPSVTGNLLIGRYMNKMGKGDRFEVYKDRLIAQLTRAKNAGVGSTRHAEIQKFHDLMYEAMDGEAPITAKFWSYWMNNALSGTKTWLDSFSGLVNAGFELIAQGARTPRGMWRSVSAIANNIPYAVAAAAKVASTVVNEDGVKWSLAHARDAENYLSASNQSEKLLTGWQYRSLAAWRKDSSLLWRMLGKVEAASHIMMAIDTLSGITNMQIRMTELAWEEANAMVKSQTGLKNPSEKQVEAMYKEILGTSDSVQKEIEARVNKEVEQGIIKPKEKNLRIKELSAYYVPENILEESIEYGMTATGMRTPYGLPGFLYRWITGAKVMEGPGGAIMRANHPFVLFAANFTNVLMDWMPATSQARLWYHSPNWEMDAKDRKFLGSKKLADVAFSGPMGRFRDWWSLVDGPQGKKSPNARNVSSVEYNQMRYRSAIGLGGILGALMFFSQWDDDEEPALMLTGSLNQLSRDQRRNMMEAGIMPYSIVVGGKSFSYKLFPVAAALAMVGTMQDQKRFGGDQSRTMSTLASAMFNGATIVKEFSMMSGLMDSLDMVMSMSTKPETKAATLAGVLGRFAAPAVMPWNAFQKDAISWIQTIFDSPVQRDPVTVSGEFFRTWAWGNWALNAPAVNVLGEDVNVGVAPWSRQVQPMPEDSEAWRAVSILSQRGVHIPVISFASKTDPQNAGKRIAMTQPEVQAYRSYVTKDFGKWFKRNHARLLRVRPDIADSQIRSKLDKIRRRARYHLNLR